MHREAETRLGREVVHGECCCGCGQPTKPATKTSAEYGWIIGEPMLYLHGHGSRGRKLNQAPDYIIDENECWIWQKARKSTGYGHLGVKGRSVPAHRHYYEQTNGPVTKGQELHHLCGVKLCVNPDHLKPLTRAEHMRLDGRIGRSAEFLQTLGDRT